MRGMILAALALGLAAPAGWAEAAQVPQAPQAPEAKEYWTVSDQRLSFGPARLSAPRRAAGVEYFETAEFSHKGEGLDTAIKYRSADQKIFATLYVYYPSFAHSGVQAIATDQAIRGPRSPAIRALGGGIAPAAGTPGVAVTADYDHYLGENRTKAAFIKAGRWMVKLRVTGPESRSAEVEAVMAAVLGGLRFEGATKPVAAMPLAAGECEAGDRADAGPAPGGGEAITIALADAAGQPAGNAKGGDRKGFPSRIGRGWCRTLLQVGEQKTAVLQATGKSGSGPRSVMLVLYSDSGGVLEVVHVPKERKYLLLHHDIAEVKVLESFDSLPSLAQIGRLFSGQAPTSIRARVRLKPDGPADVELPGAPENEG